MAKKRIIDFRQDDRNTGIPRNYFLINGDVYNISTMLDEKLTTKVSNTRGSSSTTTRIGNKTSSSSSSSLQLCDSPDRAGALLFVEIQKKKKHEKKRMDERLKDYHRFILEGPKTTDGSYISTLENQTIHGRKLLFPSYSTDQIVKNLQR